MCMRRFNYGNRGFHMKIKLTLMLCIISLFLLSFPVCAEEGSQVTISFAGDFTLGNYAGQGYPGSFNECLVNNGTDYFLENVKSLFESDDITFINLEGSLTDHPATANKKYPIKGNVEGVSMLSGAGIEVVNLSNNHIYDCGSVGFAECKNLLNNAGIKYCGEGNLCIVEKNGIKVGFLGYNAFSVGNDLKEGISEDIQLLRGNGADVVCVMFHYGIERDYYPSSVQKDISRYTIDAGADIVLGGHPHVLQGVEKYNGKVICYSLGNFCFGANKNPDDKDTMIFQQTFIKTSNGVEYGASNVIPCSISSVSSRNDFKPTVLTGDDAERVLNRLREMSSVFDDTVDTLRR